jgi:hypothetical protein
MNRLAGENETGFFGRWPSSVKSHQFGGACVFVLSHAGHVGRLFLSVFHENQGARLAAAHNPNWPRFWLEGGLMARKCVVWLRLVVVRALPRTRSPQVVIGRLCCFLARQQKSNHSPVDLRARRTAYVGDRKFSGPFQSF